MNEFCGVTYHSQWLPLYKINNLNHNIPKRLQVWRLHSMSKFDGSSLSSTATQYVWGDILIQNNSRSESYLGKARIDHRMVVCISRKSPSNNAQNIEWIEWSVSLEINTVAAPFGFALDENELPLIAFCCVFTTIVTLFVPSPNMFLVFPELPSTIFILDLLLLFGIRIWEWILGNNENSDTLHTQFIINR